MLFRSYGVGFTSKFSHLQTVPKSKDCLLCMPCRADGNCSKWLYHAAAKIKPIKTFWSMDNSVSRFEICRLTGDLEATDWVQQSRFGPQHSNTFSQYFSGWNHGSTMPTTVPWCYLTVLYLLKSQQQHCTTLVISCSWQNSLQTDFSLDGRWCQHPAVATNYLLISLFNSTSVMLNSSVEAAVVGEAAEL